MTSIDHTIAREFEAALAWWHMAGVDHDFSDDATAWLADRSLDAVAAAAKPDRAGSIAAPDKANEPAAPRAVADTPSPAPATLRRDLLGESPPPDCAAFRDWWLSAPSLDTARAYPRIAPRGAAGAQLMVLVPQPETGDSDQLLSGPQGRLLGNILAAMGLDESAVYIASALPCHTPMADLALLAAGGMDAVTAHHISLVRPDRVIAFGTGLSPMLTDVNLKTLSHNNYGNANLPVMMSETLEAITELPRLKVRFWRRWMEWSATS